MDENFSCLDKKLKGWTTTKLQRQKQTPSADDGHMIWLKTANSCFQKPEHIWSSDNHLAVLGGVTFESNMLHYNITANKK